MLQILTREQEVQAFNTLVELLEGVNDNRELNQIEAIEFTRLYLVLRSTCHENNT